MFDVPMRLQENAHLLLLLSYYAQLGAEDRTVWQDRLMRMDGISLEQLTILHGELIARDWIEQNTGHALFRPDGTLAACYRITPHGLREFRRLHGIEVVEEHSDAPAKPQPRVPRKKKDKEKKEPQAVTVSE